MDAIIVLKSKTFFELSNIESIKELANTPETEVKVHTEFENFVLVKGSNYTFVSNKKTVSCSENEIEYVQFT